MSTEKKNLIVSLHGFLGEPTDWAFLRDLGSQNEYLTPNLWTEPELGPEHNFSTWAKNFQNYLEKNEIEKYDKKILCGYSMGGRLAAHHLVSFPDTWSCAFLISTNPGLISTEEKSSRVQNDKIWSQRFLQWDWEQVLKEWNSQSVFKDGVKEPARRESKFSREKLAGALTEWSLGRQQNLREPIANLGEKVLCMTGEKDTKFTSLTEEWTMQETKLDHLISSRSGHRIIFDDPEFIFRNVELFLQKKSRNSRQFESPLKTIS